MKSISDFASDLIYEYRELAAAHYRYHGNKYCDYIDELNGYQKMRFFDRIKEREEETIKLCKTAGWEWIKANCENTVLMGDSFEAALDKSLEPPK